MIICICLIAVQEIFGRLTASGKHVEFRTLHTGLMGCSYTFNITPCLCFSPVEIMRQPALSDITVESVREILVSFTIHLKPLEK